MIYANPTAIKTSCRSCGTEDTETREDPRANSVQAMGAVHLWVSYLLALDDLDVNNGALAVLDRLDGCFQGTL